MTLYQIHRLGRRLDSRFPLIGVWLRRRAAKKLAREAGSSVAARYLARAAASHGDRKVRAVALEAVCAASAPRCIDEIVRVWAETRDPELRRAVVDRGWMASSPPEARVLSALAADRLQTVTKGAPNVAAPLVAALADAEADIAERARAALGKLRRQETIDAVCEELVRAGRPDGLQLALDAGYTPSDGPRRALFLFMTGRWQDYDDLDFDRRLLQAVYESADETLRRRITGQMRAAGRVDLLPLVTGGDRLTRVSRMTPAEAEFLIDMTSRHELWDKLWRLVFELPVAESARALIRLAESGWLPQPADERRIFDELRRHAEATGSLTAEELSRDLPPALECERLRTPGRINAVAFSPRRSVLAIGTGTGRVVEWDFQRAERTALHRDFEHSIGCVGFTHDDVLVCGERSSLRDAWCSVVALGGGERVELTRHRGPVTALAPLAGSTLLSGGRDRRVAVLDVGARGEVEDRLFHYWPRSFRVSPNGERLVLLHKSVTTLSLPGLDDDLRTLAHPHPGVSVCADFAPDSETVIVGKHNGYVVVFGREAKGLVGEHGAFTRFSAPVKSVQSLAGRRIVVTAGGDGQVVFTAWDSRRTVGEIAAGGGRLTSLTVSPDGAYMAIGDTDASLTLWDLRPLDIPLLFSLPLARSTPGHLAAAGELAASPRVGERVKPALLYLQDVLKHRFRFDVELADVPAIKVGEFDIELE